MCVRACSGSDDRGRKISFEKSAMTVSLKLGGGGGAGGGAPHAPVIEKVDEAFISNNPSDTNILDRYNSNNPTYT